MFPITNTLIVMMMALTSTFALGNDDEWQDDWQEPSPWQGVTGFAQFAVGHWSDQQVKSPISNSINELRLALETGYEGQSFNATIKSDFLYDASLSKFTTVIRQATISANFDNANVKVGRQILTWGTGDFLFVNDLFRKDWQSFFNGRDDQYLKASADAIKLNYFYQPQRGNPINFDLVWQPSFNSDRYINGSRFSFYDQQRHLIAVPQEPINVDEPNHQTLALRTSFSYLESDLALYINKTYAGTPHLDPSNNTLYFPELDSIGASMITPLASGLFKVETAFYQFKNDNTSQHWQQTKLLIGYETELLPRLNIAGQIELTHDLNSALSSNDKNRQVMTTSLNYRNSNESWLSSVFVFYSPNQHDSYVRASLKYRHNDSFSINAGVNIFNGDPAIFFGQFNFNDNIYLKLNYHF